MPLFETPPTNNICIMRQVWAWKHWTLFFGFPLMHICLTTLERLTKHTLLCCSSERTSGGGRGAGDQSSGGPVAAHEELPHGERHAHSDAGPHPMLQHTARGSTGLLGMYVFCVLSLLLFKG